MKGILEIHIFDEREEMEKRNFLFLFTITPVQGFIEQSRKLVDLYSSSEILSNLTKEGLKVFLNEVGKGRMSPIFPAFDGEIEEEGERSYPNRFLVKVEGTSLEEVRRRGNEVERVLKEKVRGLWKKFIWEGLEKLEKEKREEIEKIFDHSEVEKKIEEHVRDYFNFYWAIAEIEDGNYKKAFDTVERRLAGAKNIRFFTQLGNGKGERGRKCNLCGERNVVVYRGREKGSLFLENEKEAIELKHFILKSGEGLCGVCFSKRLKNLGLLSRCRNGEWIGDLEWSKNEGKEKHKFPSLYAITYPEYLEKREEIEQRLCSFTFRLVKKLEEKVVPKLEVKEEEKAIVEFPKIDMEVLNYKEIPMEVWEGEIKEFFTIEYREKLEKLPEFKREVRKGLERFQREFKEYLREASPYYAIIMFDGDKMGEWLSGKYLKDEGEDEGRELEKFHRTLSKNLALFAEELKGKSETSEFPVSVVYAGGDDFLGLCNLNNLFQVLKYLRKRWDEVVNTNELKKFVKDGKEFTFSIGVTIAHTKTPFHYVLKEARLAEKEAKNLFERNAICFKFLKRSGEVRKSGVRNSLEVLELMERVMNSFEEGVPNRFVSKLDRELREMGAYSLVNFDKELVPEKGYEFVDENWHEMVEVAIARNLKRGYEGEGVEEKIELFKELLEREREFVGEIGMKKLGIYEDVKSLEEELKEEKITPEEFIEEVQENLDKETITEKIGKNGNYFWWYIVLLYILHALQREITRNKRSGNG